MKIRVTSQFQVAGEDGDLEPRIDRVMHELVALERAERDVSEADVVVTIADHTVGISVVVDTETWEAAEARANEVIWQAIERAESGRDQTGDRLDEHVQSTELVPA